MCPNFSRGGCHGRSLDNSSQLPGSSDILQKNMHLLCGLLGNAPKPIQLKFRVANSKREL